MEAAVRGEDVKVKGSTIAGGTRSAGQRQLPMPESGFAVALLPPKYERARARRAGCTRHAINLIYLKKLLVYQKRLLAGLTVATVFFSVAGATAFAEKRVALVVGNAAYNAAGMSLANPRNDAEDVAKVLQNLDFDVMTKVNAGKREMDQALAEFARQARDADSVLFFYAGHALQYQGRNFLIPTDADLEDAFTVRYQAVSLEDVRSALERVSGVKIMILDACRNNPLADRLQESGASRSPGAATRGLARADKTEGMVVAYATAADAVAQDGQGRNSPFTAALLKRLQEPGLEIEMMFRRVASDVNRNTGGRQRPETTVSLLSEYYLNQNDRLTWEATDKDDVAALRAFMSRFPASPHAVFAGDRLELLERLARERETAHRDQGQEAREEARSEGAGEPPRQEPQRQRRSDDQRLFEAFRKQQQEERRRDEAIRQRLEEARRKDASRGRPLEEDRRQESTLQDGEPAWPTAGPQDDDEAVRLQRQADHRRLEATCHREEAILARLKVAAGAAAREQMAKLASEAACKMLRPVIAEAIAALPQEAAPPPVRVNQPEQIRHAQAELKRLGCFRGTPDGRLSEATRDALKEFDGRIRRRLVEVRITDGFVEDLKRYPADLCAPQVRRQAPAVASNPPAGQEAAAPPPAPQAPPAPEQELPPATNRLLKT